jgi:ectoine hydroxylase
VYGGATGPLSDSDLASDDANGFMTRTPLLGADEVAGLNADLSAWLADPTVPALDETITEPNSGSVRSVFRIHELHPRFAALARDPRLLDVARQILGGEVYLHQSRVNFKPGFAGKEFYWHSDFETWHVEDGMPRMRALSVSVALTDNHPFNGPLMVIPGSHRTYVACVGRTPDNHYKASLKKQEYGVPDHDSLTRLAARGGIEAPTGPAGTAVFFDCNTMHGSNSNITPFARSNVFFVYNSVENQLQDPFCGLTPRPAYIATRGRVTPIDRLSP